jgi:DHA1 family bicyclomycin/chloramphenicol resistance-like MFS transporter
MSHSLARLALVFGLLSVIGPIAIDMYLPALPVIAADLGTDVGEAQLSLVSFFVALAVGQPLYGPLSDMFGRKPPLYFGLALFVVAAAGCLFAGDIGTLVALRFVQGFGICAVATIVRAAVRDLHTGPEAAQLISLSLLVLSISPILAPLAGSAIIAVFPWRAIFFTFVVAGLAGLAVTAFMLQETLPPARRVPLRLRQALADHLLLFRDRRFMGLTITTAFAHVFFFAYIIGSASYFIGAYGLAPWTYSIVFATNAMGLIGLMQFSATLMRRFGSERLVLVASAINAVVLAALFLLTVTGLASLPVAMPLLFLSCSTFGLIVAPGSVLAIDAHGDRAGTASSLIGTLQFAFGAAAGGLASVLYNGTGMAVVSVMAVGALATLAFAIATLRRQLVA